MDQAKLGSEALAAGNYAEAVKQYTAALLVSPTSPDYLIKRSTAYQRSSPPDLHSALADANSAVLCAQKRAKRELIIQAQLRRAIILFNLEQYANSRFILDIVKRMDPKEKTLPIWEKKVDDKLAASETASEVTVKETPEVEASQPPTKPEAPPPSTTTTSATSTAPAAPAQTPANKIRHDWYQNNDNIYFTLLAKGVPKDKATVDIQPQSLTISFPIISTSSTFDFSLDPLFASIDPSASSFSIMSTKIEVVLKKLQPGHKWSALESNEPNTSTPSTTTTSAPSNPTPVQPAGPSYPTSSRTGPKNWDKVATDLTSKPSTDPSKKGSTEDDDEEKGGDAVNAFFKKLYAGADPDVRRAMMKSFTESNGTALSTNWDEVRKAKVETKPPEGVEAKKWG